MQMNAAFALVPGPDNRQWVAWQVTDGSITVTFPAIDPVNIGEFADAIANGLKEAGKQADRTNTGLLIPGFNLDPTLLEQLKHNTPERAGTMPPAPPA